MSVTAWWKIISGENREWYADLARLGLTLASFPYGLVSELRNRAYSTGALPIRGVPVPVISIGNLTVGGTGKTPTVAWLVRQLQDLGERPAIVSRGYHALDDAENDEKKLLDHLCPSVPHHQGRDRRSVAQRLLTAEQVSVILLDDAFQHRRLHRDLDLVLVDSLNPWGFDRLLPRGLLRERLAGLSRADLILLTRCELVPPHRIQDILRQIRRWSGAPVLQTRFLPSGLTDGEGNRFPLDAVAGKPVVAFCGIGNPEGFQKTLSPSVALSAENFRTFPDHHHYTPADLLELRRLADQCGAEQFLTTRKDLVKLPVDGILGLPCRGLDIELQVDDDLSPLLDRLRMTLRSPLRDRTP